MTMSKLTGQNGFVRDIITFNSLIDSAPGSNFTPLRSQNSNELDVRLVFSFHVTFGCLGYVH